MYHVDKISRLIISSDDEDQLYAEACTDAERIDWTSLVSTWQYTYKLKLLVPLFQKLYN